MCTAVRFTSAENTLLFGRNLDWSATYGAQMLAVPRTAQHIWALAHEPNEGRISAAAVIGMGIVSGQTPLFFDCANEHGLAIAGLNFPESAHYEPRAVSGKNNIAAFEFPFWVARCFDTVDRVQDALHDICLVDCSPDGRMSASPLHWIIADAKRSIVVEQTACGLAVHDNDLDVLANEPPFDWHRHHVRSYLGTGPENPEARMWGSAPLSACGSGLGMRGIPGDCYSPSRFVRAAYYNAHYPQQSGEKDNVSKLFHILGSVSVIDGAAMMPSGDFERTLYSSGFSEATLTYYRTTYDDPSLQAFPLGEHLEGDDIVSLG